jgi:hypothetical protein
VQLALALYWSPQRERREQLVDEALVIARAIFTGVVAQQSAGQRALADRTLAFALAQGFVAVLGPDTVTRGLPISVEALELCERTNDTELSMFVRLWRISLLLELDDPVRADEEIEAFGVTARRLGQPRMLVYDPLHRALAAHLRGDFAEAEHFTAEAAARSRDVPGSMGPIIADAQTFLGRRTQGRHLDLVPLVRTAAARLPAMCQWRCALALVLAECGREDEARREIEQLAASDFDDVPRDTLWLAAMSLLAELCALLDDGPRARRLYELMVPYDGRNVVSMGAAYLGPVARYLGLLAMAMGEPERALGHLETARSASERMGARPMVVLTALDAAEVLVRRGAAGDAQRALALVRHAAPEAERMQMDGAIARVTNLRGRLEETAVDADVPAESQPRSMLAALRREQDIWMLSYEGRSICLHDAKGLHHLAALLASPGTPIAAVDLAADQRSGGGGAVNHLAAQRDRARALQEDLADGQAHNDPERVARTRAEPEARAAELTTQDEASVAIAERARINVTRSLRAAVRRIGEHDVELGQLLDRRIQTGSWCSYQPDPGTSLHWDVQR